MMDGADCPISTFSLERNDADLTAKDIRLSANGVRFAAVTDQGLALTKLGIPGLFSVHNALGVMSVGLALGVSLDDCADAMSSARGVKGRLEIVPTDRDYSIIIDYSHKPDALENVLKTLKPVTRGRLIALCGCGGTRSRTRARLIRKQTSFYSVHKNCAEASRHRLLKAERLLENPRENRRHKRKRCLRVV